MGSRVSTLDTWPLDELLPRELPEKPFCDSVELDGEGVSEVPLFGGHSLTFHQLGLILSATFSSIAVVISFYLIWRHASHYLKPYEQRHIIRILVMIPIYAVVSFFSYLNYEHAIYYEVLRDCYEAFAIASFFTLLCHYIAPNLHDQKQYFRDIEPRNWVWPLTWVQKCTGGVNKGIFRRPRSGLTWFNILWISIFQYCFIRPFFTLVAVVTQASGVYCQSSNDPRFAYIYVTVFDAVSVTIAMYCLIQFYLQLKTDLAPHRPFLKITSIKLVIFFCFWQSWIISLLAVKGGPLQATATVGMPDWRVGLPSMLVCVEMSLFAVLHLFAFPWTPYDLKKLPHSENGYVYGPFRALLSALNPWDIIKAFSRGLRWLFVGVRHRTEDPSYKRHTSIAASNTAYQPHSVDKETEATEMVTPKVDTSYENNRSADSDTAGLLSHAQANAYTPQDSYEVQSDRPGPFGDEHAPASPHRVDAPLTAPSNPFENQDEHYIPGGSYGRNIQ